MNFVKCIMYHIRLFTPQFADISKTFEKEIKKLRPNVLI